MIISKKMPMLTSLLLLVLSWLIAIIGFAAGVWVIIQSPMQGADILKGIGVILFSFLLASVVRMLANIGQMLFELKDYSLGFQQVLQQNISLQFQYLNKNIESQAATMNQLLETNFNGINEGVFKQVESLKSGIDVTFREQVKDLNESVNQQLSAQAKVIRDGINEQLMLEIQQFNKNLNEHLTTQFQGLREGFRDVLSTQSEALKEKIQDLKDVNLQTNCDARETSENVFQIRSFFDEISKHLELRK